MKGESPDQADIKCLPVKKGGRPLLLGEKLDTQVKSYLRAVCEGGGVVTTAITMAAATAIVRKGDRNLLSENGGPITITKKLGQVTTTSNELCQKKRQLNCKDTSAKF